MDASPFSLTFFIGSIIIIMDDYVLEETAYGDDPGERSEAAVQPACSGI